MCRQNAAKNRVKKETLTNELKETVLSLQKDLREKNQMLNQVSLSLHNEMKITADLRASMKPPTVP